MIETARCRDLAPLLEERASGALAPEEDADVAAHLEGCHRCRAEAARCVEVLEMVRPAADAIEDSELSRLAASALGAYRRSERRSRVVRNWWAGGFAAVAAAAAVALAPLAMRYAPGHGPTAVHRWEPPDPDALWKAAAPSAVRPDDDAEAEVALFALYDGAEADEPARRSP